jgi:hypothetical protein
MVDSRGENLRNANGDGHSINLCPKQATSFVDII